MLTLSPALIAEKNKIESEGAWVYLIHLASPDNIYDLKFARNTEDILYNGDTYQAFPFEMGEAKEESSGKISGLQLQVSNIDRIAQSYIEQDETFGSNWDVTLLLIHTELVNTEDFTPLSYKFKSKSVICDKEYATFTLGLPSPIRMQTPYQKYSPISCQRSFNDGRGCPYVPQVNFEYQSYPEKYIKDNNTTFIDGISLSLLASSLTSYNFNQGVLNNDFYLAFVQSNYAWISTGDNTSKVQDLNDPQWFSFTYSTPKVISGFSFSCWTGTKGYSGVPSSYTPPSKIVIQAKIKEQDDWIILHEYSTNYINGDIKVDIPNENLGKYQYYRLLFDDFTNFPNSASAIGLSNVILYEKNITQYTHCNGTLAECKERYPNGRVLNGVNLGFPFNGKLGMTQQAIYK